MLMQIKVRVFVLIAAFVAQAAGVSGCSGTPGFDPKKAFEFLKTQCEYGPRPVGSKAHDDAKAYLIKQLKLYADSVETQDFNHKGFKLSNIIARFGSSAQPSVLLCAHWDTRPTADQELDPSKRTKPIIGANDGASGVAVLLELSRLFKEQRPPVPVTIVLFDGEDFGPTSADMFLGSRHFAETADKHRLRYGILVDMVGDKELKIPREQYSNERAKWVVDKVWATAKRLGHSKVFENDVGFAVIDDHLPLLAKGIPCIAVIDFDYAYWHTLADATDKCSPESLRVVGETIASVVYSESPPK